MTIDDFIYENSIVRDNVSEYTADHIDRVIESVCNNYGLTIKMISTNYVFPRIIKASEEKALIWDQTYWELFSLYLAYFTDLNAIQKKIIVYDESSVQPKILIPFAYYLALIVEDKKLALNFANYYNYRIHRCLVCDEHQYKEK
ncbi:hypothetical protein DV740_03880 [Roseburia sp. AF02-12]|uniref:hypothetical protein n=1 Tax=unclassified Roseburia TaxID=2637578 RepID=UPI000E5079D8|nr:MULTISPECIES: hypothetical protein [unclassified Roseburia]RGF60186.1 hypothetical protein DWZ65_04350 [Roseburia sp. AF34-16]RGH30559.1 hypothetical protein DV740_03880 [Roseburia sp. AF02-12]